MPCSFDYLIYPQYPAYTMECYQIVIRRDNNRLAIIFARIYYSGNYLYYQVIFVLSQLAAHGSGFYEFLERRIAKVLQCCFYL